MLSYLLLVNFILFKSSVALLAQQFQDFIVREYGEEVKDKLTRADLSWGQSFGGEGRNHSGPTLMNPVIFVHGIQNHAGTYKEMMDEFLAWGYANDEIYATTWAYGGDTPLLKIELKCEYVKQTRQFIEAVSAFTQSTVDVIGYSMGSPLARKAILGGLCVDDEDVHLGEPLTDKIHTFLSVAGANWGSHACLPSAKGVCSRKAGLFCGSKFIKDINSETEYEGKEIYALYTKRDEWIGTRTVCHKKPYTFEGATVVETKDRNHDQLCVHNYEAQIELITKKQFVQNMQKDTFGQIIPTVPNQEIPCIFTYSLRYCNLI